MRKIKLMIILMAGALLCTGSSALADDIEDEINGALSAYKKGEYTKAISGLEFATQQIRQLKAEEIKTLFPEPLEGWTAGEAESMAAGTMFLGGVISSSREYRRDTASVEISIAADNPMISFVSGMLANPAVYSIASQFGGAAKVVKIKGAKAISEWDAEKERGSIRMVMANKLLISVMGKNCKEKDLLDYAEAIDYAKIRHFVSD